MKTNQIDVVESAKALFERHGFKKVTMIDIAEAAEISRPTLYAMFNDKDAVFAASVQSYVDRFRVEAQARISRERQPAKQLRAVFDVYITEVFERYHPSKEAHDLLRNADSYAPKEMKLFWQDFAGHIEGILKTPKSLRRDHAQILVSFARDVRLYAKTPRELKHLVDVAIQLVV